MGWGLRRAAVIAAAVPAALVAVLGVEAYLTATAEYLPGDPGYVVEATVEPEGVPADAEPLRLVVLGDSTVAGVGSPTAADSVAVLVADRVAQELDRPVTVVGHGVSGARTATVLTEQVSLLDTARADVVLLVIGSNDVTHVTRPGDLRRQTEALIRAAREASGAPVVLGGIPQFRTVPALAQPLRWVVGRYAVPLREVQRSVAAELDAPFVDIAALASPRFVGLPESMSSDGFHPSPLGYGFWADALAPAVADAVRND
ncbi:MAG: SGNH/GDSL hydrolase family protein [Euzebyaceae bacterium]|nr:SGNH/GDSL hydrolase family protein [Euzebyaceae bacterium]